ncbi:hypothetical protein POVWA2_061060 [Plasmodium ovale wallikeri]|uniref:Uncharacterized protein n=1 Tax=Plasmodium ovale wallikeri TaxID=864142 RepID=A0A1A9A3S9_PLAOA|nr:hypothetical protein POVWA1_061510 [Plasmodium ovale wallikeri]SBT50864.1 hypothetical protein POVWA2_061060 [Plasmodium ovale wallikeri]
MKRLAEFYAYSRNESAAFFTLKKKAENEKKKTENSWMGKLCSEFEGVKNETLKYVTVKKSYWKEKLSRFNFCSHFKCDDSKYGNFPWYKKLYYVLKREIYKLFKLGDKNNVDGEKDEGGKDEGGKKKRHELHLDDNRVTRDFASYENFDYKNKQKQKNSDDSIFSKYREKLRKTRENETYPSERSQSELVKRNMSSCSVVLPLRSIKSVLDDINMAKDENSLTTDANEEDFCDAKEAKEMGSNDAINMEKKHFLNVEKTPKFNIKNTWEKLSGYIS